ncbi:MAG: ATP-binding protein [Opitutaceae bacterium]|nr:ATP-binding protein [Opitutaceae bacterium]
MNKLLARQLRKHLPGVDLDAEPLRSFLAAVDMAYQELQQDCDHIERTLELTSNELTEANERLRREAEQNLRQLNETYRQTLELQEGMILCFRREGPGFVHTLCRGQLATRLGWTPQRAEGKSAETILPENGRAPLLHAYARAWEGESCAVEFASGAISLLACLRPRVSEGKVEEVIVSAIEITTLKQFEQELRLAKDRAERADRAKSEFLAVMSHEIRTPLNAILGFTELLVESEVDEQRRLWLQTVASSGESLRALIEDILDFSKIEAGMVEIHKQRVVILDLVRNVKSMFLGRAIAKGIQFITEVAPDVPGECSADANRLKQILINLVGNAVKFTSNGLVRVRVDSAGPGAHPSTTLLRFSVEDTGIGIQPDHHERIFKPFSQADSSTTRVYGGTGLGLVISQRLVRLMGGEIHFTSEAGVGTTFVFTIEVDRAAPAPAPRDKTFTVAPYGLHVLVVEDRIANQQLMREILNRFGCNSEFADNGRQAVDSAAKRKYDIIIMDLQMPEMDGFDATRLIRAQPGPSRDARIVALTASTLSEQHSRCREVGMDAVLTKPLRFEALKAELALAVGNSGL